MQSLGEEKKLRGWIWENMTTRKSWVVGWVSQTCTRVTWCQLYDKMAYGSLFTNRALTKTRPIRSRRDNTWIIAGGLSIKIRLIFDKDNDRSLRLNVHVWVVRLYSHIAQMSQTLVKGFYATLFTPHYSTNVFILQSTQLRIAEARVIVYVNLID